MALLGEDGRGFELARKLESIGVWRPWLGDALYANFVHYLSSPSSWETFMRSDDTKSRAHIQVQLRARALLFDKVYVSLFLRSNQSPSALISKLNPQYLQLHGDDVYFTLENSSLEGVQHPANAATSKVKSAFGVGSRYGEPEINHNPQRFRQEELPKTWYSQFFEKYRASKPYKLSCRDNETDVRTPEQMFTYHKVLEKHKRRRVAFREDQNQNLFVNTSSMIDDEETIFFPETMFTVNCVPDNALPRINCEEIYNHKVEFNGVLDNLPQIMTRSPIMIERLGIRPEYLNTEHGGKSGRVIGEDQAVQISKKVVSRILTTVGFEAASEVPMEVLSQLLSCHACKLGRILKVLADNYRKQCSAVELIKMFLHTAGFSNLGALAELVKDNTRSNIVQPTQQHPQMFSQHHNPVQHSQQIQQMQQMINPQNMTAQQKQQWERIRRQRQQQLSAPRPVMNINNIDSNSNIINNNIMKDRIPIVQVKLETPSDFPMESTNLAFNPIINNSRQHLHMQFRQHHQQQQQQQLIGGGSMSNILHSQTGNQFSRPLTSLQIPQNLSINMGMVRAPPVKVEGFQELMGGDSSLKHGSEENKLTSPR